MASQSGKKLAVANTTTLNQLLAIAASINFVCILALFILKRPQNKVPYIVFSLPALTLQYLLEKYGRPVYSGNKMIRSGEEISGPGLYEYMFDIVYLTWILDVLMVIFGSNKVWWLFSSVPLYAGWKIWGVASPFLSRGKSKGEEPVAEKSKRQEKLEKRRDKGQVRYR